LSYSGTVRAASCASPRNLLVITTHCQVKVSDHCIVDRLVNQSFLRDYSPHDRLAVPARLKPRPFKTIGNNRLSAALDPYSCSPAQSLTMRARTTPSATLTLARVTGRSKRRGRRSRIQVEHAIPYVLLRRWVWPLTTTAMPAATGSGRGRRRNAPGRSTAAQLTTTLAGRRRQTP